MSERCGKITCYLNGWGAVHTFAIKVTGSRFEATFWLNDYSIHSAIVRDRPLFVVGFCANAISSKPTISFIFLPSKDLDTVSCPAVREVVIKLASLVRMAVIFLMAGIIDS